MRRIGLAGVAGGLILLLFALGSIGAPLISPYDPQATTGTPFSPPSAAHWLGTNDIGQDILSELIWGSRVSLAIGVLAAVIGTGLGAAAGLLAGFLGGRVDDLLMRTVDVVLVLPFLPLMIVLAAYVAPSIGTLALVIGVLVWARPARVIRSQVLTQTGREYVAAARALGGSEWHILRQHVASGVAPIVIAEFVQLASRAILLEASLAFLGLGDPVRKSWGTVLYYAQARGAFLSGSWPWWVVPPGLLIVATVVAFALVGLDLERAVNPRLAKGSRG